MMPQNIFFFPREIFPMMFLNNQTYLDFCCKSSIIIG